MFRKLSIIALLFASSVMAATLANWLTIYLPGGQAPAGTVLVGKHSYSGAPVSDLGTPDVVLYEELYYMGADGNWVWAGSDGSPTKYTTNGSYGFDFDLPQPPDNLKSCAAVITARMVYRTASGTFETLDANSFSFTVLKTN